MSSEDVLFGACAHLDPNRYRICIVLSGFAVKIFLGKDHCVRGQGVLSTYFFPPGAITVIFVDTGTSD